MALYYYMINKITSNIKKLKCLSSQSIEMHLKHIKNVQNVQVCVLFLLSLYEHIEKMVYRCNCIFFMIMHKNFFHAYSVLGHF